MIEIVKNAIYQTQCLSCKCLYKFSYNDTRFGSSYFGTSGREICCPNCRTTHWFSNRKLNKLIIKE